MINLGFARKVVVLALLFVLSVLSNVNAESLVSHPSYGAMGADKKPFGEYLRTQITDSSSFPARVVGRLEAEEYSCTGTLIGPKHVITAAHCVYDTAASTWATNLRFSPGQLSDNEKPYGTIKAVKFYINKNYLSASSGVDQNDYAVIELESPIGDQLGWAGYKVIAPEVESFTSQIIGYPGDKERGTLWGVECPAVSVENNAVAYRCDTYGGMSGSAVRKKEDFEYVVGVHTFGTDEFNGGWLLNSSRFSSVLSWVKNENISDDTIIHEDVGNSAPPVQNFHRIEFTNRCGDLAKIVLTWYDLDNEWHTDGFFQLAPGQTGYLADTQNKYFYFHATALDNGEEYEWSGNQAVTFKDQTFNMVQVEINLTTWGRKEVVLNCQ